MLRATIADKQKLSHNVYKITLETIEALELDDSSFFVYIHKADERFKRPYTPILYSSKQLVFIIKFYNTNGVADYICAKDIGDLLLLSHPIYELPLKDCKGENVLMLAGGTGITPMLQVLNSLKTNVHYTIVWSNRNEEDIVLREDLVDTQNKFTLYNVLSNPTQEIKTNGTEQEDKPSIKGKILYSRLTKDLLQSILIEMSFKPSFVYCCGPDEYLKDVCGSKAQDKTQGELGGIVKQLGFTPNEVYKF